MLGREDGEEKDGNMRLVRPSRLKLTMMLCLWVSGYWARVLGTCPGKAVSWSAKGLLFDQTRNDSCRLKVKSGLILQKCRNLEELGSELREFVSSWSYFCRGIVCCVVVCVLVTTALATRVVGN